MLLLFHYYHRQSDLVAVKIMVYKLRNKGLWNFSPGLGYYDKNFHPFIKAIVPPKDQTYFITYKNPSYFPFRILHVYRTIKRASNQFFQGNKLLEQSFTLALRGFYYRVPKEMLKRYGGWDMLVHKGERHWEAMTYNQHPLQHDIYEIFNAYCEKKYGRTKEQEENVRTFVNDFLELCKSKREKLGLADHETLEMDDLAAAFNELMKKERADPSSDLFVKTQEQEEADFDKENPKRPSYFQ